MTAANPLAIERRALAPDPRDDRARAWEAAARAQTLAGLEVRGLQQVEELRCASDLFSSIWGRTVEAGPPINADLLRALAHAGNYVAGAFDAEGQMRGALVGFLGGPGARAHLHSHILGVEQTRQVRGAGFALKLHQRAWAVQNGCEQVRWTFDPLVRRNAYFNLGKLGAEIDSYAVNFYGAMDDEQNRLDESDRIVVRWDLLSARAVAAAAGAQGDLGPVSGPTGVRTLAVGDTKMPQVAPLNGATTVLLEVPEDIVRMRAEAPELAAAWRRVLREKVQEVLNAGYTCTGVSRRGEYVFARASGS
ncbi:MAG: GNAT family N-acetyltransferase [Candidatus Dormibacteraeota bacterium]|nr:GNAT family N-acetyltransferase [Candidatus Dormibacteraeota bacterium]